MDSPLNSRLLILFSLLDRKRCMYSKLLFCRNERLCYKFCILHQLHSYLFYILITIDSNCNLWSKYSKVERMKHYLKLFSLTAPFSEIESIEFICSSIAIYGANTRKLREWNIIWNFFVYCAILKNRIYWVHLPPQS